MPKSLKLISSFIFKINVHATPSDLSLVALAKWEALCEGWVVVAIYYKTYSIRCSGLV